MILKGKKNFLAKRKEVIDIDSILRYLMPSWFDESPEIYERARPVYPDEMWDELFRRFPAGVSLVEIGPATGKATRALIARGAYVVACEPGPKLAVYLRTQVRSPLLDVRNQTFEDAELEIGAYDGVVAATSFHWVEPAVRMQKSHAVLKPGGILAVVGTNQVASDVDGGYFAASQPIYERYFPNDPPPPELPGHDVVPAEFGEIAASGLFGEPKLFRYEWDQRYPTAAYIDLVRSYSGTAQMEADEREAFLGNLAAFIDEQFDGYVVRPLVITLVCASKR